MLKSINLGLIFLSITYLLYVMVKDFHVIEDSFLKGLNLEFLDLFIITSIFFGILIIVTKNPIESVLCLISLFVSVSLYLISLGLDFIGLSYLLVYVGAVSILFLFILMLINIRISELYSGSYNNLILAFYILLSFGYFKFEFLPQGHLFTENFLTFSFNWETSLLEFTQITSIGNIMYTIYAIWFLITSLILLLAMVGAIVITISPKYERI